MIASAESQKAEFVHPQPATKEIRLCVIEKAHAVAALGLVCRDSLVSPLQYLLNTIVPHGGE